MPPLREATLVCLLALLPMLFAWTSKELHGDVNIYGGRFLTQELQKRALRKWRSSRPSGSLLCHFLLLFQGSPARLDAKMAKSTHGIELPCQAPSLQHSRAQLWFKADVWFLNSCRSLPQPIIREEETVTRFALLSPF